MEPGRLTAQVAILASAILLAGCDSAAVAPGAVSPVAAAPSPAATPVASARTPGSCHLHGQLPDPVCTPGAVDPRVTQDNLEQTICTRGYTATVRPALSYTSPLKLRQMALYGETGRPAQYEEDHLIPLELGGHPTDPRNLWPQPGASPNEKDRIENRLRDLVCAGTVPLARAQAAIAADWTAAEQAVLAR
jgi:hypothetical protein